LATNSCLSPTYTRRVTIKVDPTGLKWLASSLSGLANDLTVGGAELSQGLSCQATSAAVGMVHADVAAVGATLTTRMHSTAAKLSAVGSEYLETDIGSAQNIGAVGA
jgi:Excreted virulence factor EspC, type VII ESX diderm